MALVGQAANRNASDAPAASAAVRLHKIGNFPDGLFVCGIKARLVFLCVRTWLHGCVVEFRDFGIAGIRGVVQLMWEVEDDHDCPQYEGNLFLTMKLIDAVKEWRSYWESNIANGDSGGSISPERANSAVKF